MATLTPHQKAALQFDNHISLTANAGSGKTFVLSRRYIEIVLSEGISLRNIAAITFTDKAASELYKKIASNIEDRLTEVKDETLARKLEKMRRQLVSANISTIHSFCIDILREFPVEAGLDANFSPIDVQLSDELIELSVEEMVKASIHSNEDENGLKNLIRYFSSKNLFAGEIISLIKNRKKVLLIDDEIYSQGLENIAEYFALKFEELLPKVVLADETKIINSITEINSSVLNVKPENKIALEVIPLLDQIKNEIYPVEKLKLYLKLKDLITTTTSKIKTREYIGKLKDQLSGEIKYVENFFSSINNIEINDNSHEIEKELARLGKMILYFFKKALKIYNDKKNENGYLDYEDILLYTKELLKKENVRKNLSEKFKYIMIDEYQDTNEIQYNIFLPILDELKSGNLFVVGDEKQSIYMFRDAELKVFNKTKKDISNISGNRFLLTLPDSFRMAPAISLFNNELFKRLFANPELLYNEVEHNDLVCAREDDIKGKIEILIPSSETNNSGENNNNDGSNNLEAETVARRIIKLVFNNEIQQKLTWNDIAVLCRKRKSFTELEKAFIKYKIPFTIIGGKGFYQRQSVYDIYNYFSFLLDRKNDTALIGILRGPFFSFPDSIIFEISNYSGKCFLDKLVNYTKKELDNNQVISSLEENLNLANSYEITSLLRKILNESDLLVTISSKQNGVQEIANIRKLIKLTIKFSNQGFKTLYDYVNFLKESIEKIEDEAQAAVAEDSDSVKIMTIHQSKGLEFPAVFLFNSDDKSGNSSIKSKSFTVDKELGLLSKVPINENYFSEYLSPPVNGIAEIISKRKNLAENKRLFYVAVTRAVNYLFISASYKKDYSYDNNSFIGLLHEGLDADFNSEEIKLKAGLKFLIKEGDEFVNSEKEVEVNIPVLKNIEEVEVTANENIPDAKKSLLLSTIKDVTESEIISATKVAVYKQCPVKYQLTYEYGFGSLFQDYRCWLYKEKSSSNPEKKYIYKIKEEEESEETNESRYSEILSKHADVKGRIIHELLEKQINLQEIEDFTAKLIKREISSLNQEKNIEKKLKQEIIVDLNNYYHSGEYKYLSGFSNFKNEFEVYLAEGDYYLYGIIDKIIFEKNKIIIADYKTDDIAIDEIKEKSKAYLVQLKFYSYIVSKLYPGTNEIELRLIFIKHPDSVVIEKVDFSYLKQIKNEIFQMVEHTRLKKYVPNLFHCNYCYFAFTNKCVKK